MCSEPLPKEFEKTSEVLPFTKYGLSSIKEFQDAEGEIQHLERLKKAGLTYDEIKLYQDNEAGLLEQQKKVESSALKEKLDVIYNKLKKLENDCKSSENDIEKPSTSNSKNILDGIPQKTLSFYPEGHPMNNIKEMEEDLFGHLRSRGMHHEDIMPLSKRRKMLRRFERKKERVLAQERQVNIGAVPTTSKCERTGSLWDVKEMPPRKVAQSNPRIQEPEPNGAAEDPGLNRPIGPQNRQLYSIRDNNIVRLERVDDEEYRAVDIVLPENQAEEQLLEGTKMSIDNIMKIERFRDYDPGLPSKTLYLKNIAPTVSQEQVSLLFNQFVLANGGPIDVRLMTSGRMRGQAFVEFQEEDVCIQALEETNGTILSGQPVIAQFARNTNRQVDNR